jgi:DUF1365 family protein
VSGVYEGELVHVRRDRWARRQFRYRLYSVCVDLDDLPRLRLLSIDRPNLFSLQERDHPVGLAAGARAFLAEHGLPRPHRLELICQLRTLGYVFNPVSYYLGYDAGGALTSAILEIHNTYGGHRAYAVDPRHPAASLAAPGPVDRSAPRGNADPTCTEPRAEAPRARVSRDFFVSPFLPGDLTYTLDFGDARPDAPRLDLRIDVRRPDGERVFFARLTGARAPLDDRHLLRAAIRHPLMPVRVIGLIHWQAMKLHWARVPYRRPGPDHAPP